MLALVTLIGFALVVIVLIHLYLWKRLVLDTTVPGRWRRIGGWAVLALGLLIPATMGANRAAIRFLSWPGFVWVALMFYLLVLLLVLEVPMAVAKLVLRRRAALAEPTTAAPEPALVGAADLGTAEPPVPDPAGPAAAPPAAVAVGQPDHDPSRRLLLARGAAIFAGLTAAGITGYGVRTAMGPPRLDRVQIQLAKLPRSMDGLRIATVSDIHLGPLRGRSHTERIVAMINRLDADLVAVVGDLVDGSVAELGAAAEPLRDLRSRHGSFFVTGNHEYYSGVEEWVQEVDRLGLRVLQNARQEIRARGGVLDLAGVNDVTAAGTGLAAPADYAAALGDRDPSRPVVLLAHQPVAAYEAAKYGVDLQLSGHTHGGQMAPFNLLVKLQQPVVSGLGEVDGTKVYVTNGAGFWGPPVRVGAPPQVTLVELRAA
ncbi:metallophosphoesterase [Micromonospora sp. DR5-3]|uniref:metallophosphoesterase n=1 Tax=unclassified Micromonospora TaxID=2617518 RepID=UPI0011DC2841|nr:MULTISPECIES: metallophosphoesterase [unclassified Micromonospora]MCW3813882.1 metallophosphoesterase [Micromonospora sp. DR5-3]TYC25448.1 metallophosphoesterase [Micromonospora sp. MP36]